MGRELRRLQKETYSLVHIKGHSGRGDLVSSAFPCEENHLCKQGLKPNDKQGVMAPGRVPSPWQLSWFQIGNVWASTPQPHWLTHFRPGARLNSLGFSPAKPSSAGDYRPDVFSNEAIFRVPHFQGMKYVILRLKNSLDPQTTCPCPKCTAAD